MKRLPIIVLTFALCLLIAGCGAKPNEPADGDSAKAGIVERMATVKAEEIKYISSFFLVSMYAPKTWPPSSMPQRNTIASSPVRAWTIIRWRYTSPGGLTHTVPLMNASFSLPDWMKTI